MAHLPDQAEAEGRGLGLRAPLVVTAAAVTILPEETPVQLPLEVPTAGRARAADWIFSGTLLSS